MKYTILTILIATVLVLLFSFTKKNKDRKKEQAILNYIKENPEHSSMTLIKNGEKIVDFRSNEMMPLASTVKIIIAIEYAYQAAEGKVDPSALVSFDQLDQYYAAGTDGGAHMAWFKSIQDEISEGGIALEKVAKGMIDYSSNANTEYLMDLLGIDAINQRIQDLGIKAHSEIYYIVSALFVGTILFPDLEGQELADALEETPMEQYIEKVKEVHEKLKADPEFKKTPPRLNLAVQKVWSDRLPASTTYEYAHLMKKINGRSFFSDSVHSALNPVLEGIMENPSNQNWLKHSGAKGGSTAFVLTKSLYATDTEGNTTEMAYFFNEVGFLENALMQRSMNSFELKVLSDPEYPAIVKAFFESLETSGE